MRRIHPLIFLKQRQRWLAFVIKRRWGLLKERIALFVWMIPNLSRLIYSWRVWRDFVAADEYLFLFWYRVRRIQLQMMRSRQYFDYLFDGKINFYYLTDDCQRARREARPIIYLSWHNGSARLEVFSHRIDQQAIILSAYSVNIPNTIRADALSLVKLAKTLAGGGRIIMTLDGTFGRLDLDGHILGLPWKFSGSFITLMRQYQAELIPVTHYMNEKKELDVYFGSSLFKDVDLSSVSNQEVLERTLEYLTKDLLQRNRYQIDYSYFLYPERFMLSPLF